VNLSVAGVMHQPEIREVIRPSVTLGPHVVDVDLFPIVQSLVADRTAPVLPPGELPRTASCDWKRNKNSDGSVIKTTSR
jgi:hypothetical protein